MPKKLSPIAVNFGEDVERDIEQYINVNIDWLKRELKPLHEDRIPRWRRNYMGIPAEENKSFPWPNAANTVVQVIGETVDTAVARTMGLVWATHPVYVYQNYHKDSTSALSKEHEMRRSILQDYIDICANQPNILDLYRVEGQWFTDTCRLGTSFIKVKLEHLEEAVVVGYDSRAKKIAANDTTLYDGPRVEKLRHEDVLLDPRAQTIDKSRFKAHRNTLSRWDLEERAFQGIYDKDAVASILPKYDRTNPTEPARQELQDEGITTPASIGTPAEEWDIYECYFPWIHNGHKFQLIYTYHHSSRTVLRRVFNFLPKNRTPFIRSKLGYRNDNMYGHGYAELLEIYQEELSSTHNRRLDNSTIANVRALRVSPTARALDSNFELYPGAILVGEKDDLEAIQIGDVYPSTFDAEKMTRELVQTRAGISPSTSGFGTGGMQKRPAVYSSMGTMAVMQENNSRTGYATSEFRHAHAMLGIALTDLYAEFGVNGDEKLFGDNGHFLLDALKDYKENRLYIPLRSTSGSLNNEIYKQNSIIMKQLTDRHYQMIVQLLQAFNSPMTPPHVKDYFQNVIVSSNSLMQRIMKDFGYEQPYEYVPDPNAEPAHQQAGPPNQGGQMAPAGAPMGGNASASGGKPTGMVPMPGGQSLPAGSPSAPVPAEGQTSL